MKLKTPYYVALDIDDPTQALRLANQLKPFVGGFKVGPRLVLRGGPSIVSEFRQMAPVFLDFKFHDIPSTTIAAVQTAWEMGASVATIHASVGKTTLLQLAQLEQDLSQKRPFQIAAVTILTSMGHSDFPQFARATSIDSQVQDLVDMAYDCGLRTFVCSPHEAAVLKRAKSDLYLITPGIRSSKDQKGDQQRTMEPRQALQAGANALVIGRPILGASDPFQAAQAIASELGSV